jgi:hypothetical protein
MGNPSRPGGPKLGLRQGLVETGSEGKTRKHGGSTPRDARRWQTRCAGAGFGVMPDGGKTRALGTAYRRRRRLPSDTLIELDVGLGLAEEVPVRHRLGSILPGGRPAGGANGGGREGSPSWVKVRSMGAASMSNAALVLASTGRERPVASAGIPGSRQVEAACGRSPRSVRVWTPPRLQAFRSLAGWVRLLTCIRPLILVSALPIRGHDGLFARQLPIAFSCCSHLDTRGFCRHRFDLFAIVRFAWQSWVMGSFVKLG